MRQDATNEDQTVFIEPMLLLATGALPERWLGL
jgi:hypothetical protein